MIHYMHSMHYMHFYLFLQCFKEDVCEWEAPLCCKLSSLPFISSKTWRRPHCHPLPARCEEGCHKTKPQKTPGHLLTWREATQGCVYHHRIEGGWLRESETGQSPLERREYSDILSMGLQALEAASWNGCKETVHVFASCLTSIVTNNVVVNLLKPRGQYWKQAPPYWPPDSECWTY